MSLSRGVETPTATSARIRAEAQKLLDVAIDAKISDRSSSFLKTLLEDVSIDFSTYDTSKISRSRRHDSDEDMSISDRDITGAIDSSELSLSDSNDNDNTDANVARKQLLFKILSFPTPNNAQQATASYQQSAQSGYENNENNPNDQNYQNNENNENNENINPYPNESDDINRRTQPASYNRGEGGTDYFSGGEKVNFEITRLTDMLGDRRTQFRDLIISDAMLHDLQLKPEGELTIHELACLRSAEHSLPIKKDLESSRVELSTAQRRVRELEIMYESLFDEFERHKRMSDAYKEGDRLEKMALESRCERGAILLEGEIALRRESEEKAQRCDRMVEETARLTVENNELRTTLSQQSAALEVIQANERHNADALIDMEKIKNLLQADKLFLQSELRGAEMRGDERARENEGNISKKHALEAKLSQLTDQLLSLQATSRSEFDTKMEREIQRLRDDSHREIDTLRIASRDLADRENRVLREAKTALDLECEGMKRRIESLSDTGNQMNKEHALYKTEKNKETSELRADLKMKAFELTALGAAFEERMSQLRQVELEMEMVKEEVIVHRAAFIQLESESMYQLNTVRNALEEANKKIEGYKEDGELADQMEGEVFPAIPDSYTECEKNEAMNRMIKEELARLREGGDRDNKGLGGDKGKIGGDRYASGDNKIGGTRGDISGESVFELIRRIPSRSLLEKANKRRLLLEFHESRRELEGSRKEGAERQREIETLKSDLSHVKEPKSYLIAKLRDEEEGRRRATARSEHLEGELNERNSQLDERSKEVRGLKERLGALLSSRGELDTLKDMLTALKREEEAKEEEEEDEYDEDEEDIDRDDEEGERREERENEREAEEQRRERERIEADRQSPRTPTPHTPIPHTPPPTQRSIRDDPHTPQNPHTPHTPHTPSPATAPSPALVQGLSPSILLAMLTPPASKGHDRGQDRGLDWGQEKEKEDRGQDKGQGKTLGTHNTPSAVDAKESMEARTADTSSPSKWHTREIL